MLANVKNAGIEIVVTVLRFLFFVCFAYFSHNLLVLLVTYIFFVTNDSITITTIEIMYHNSLSNDSDPNPKQGGPEFKATSFKSCYVQKQ